MPLNIENGTGVVDADSYASVAEADAHHAAYANSVWAAAAEADKEASLRKATVYIDSTYRFKGERVEYDQALAWPRYGVRLYGVTLDSDYIPPKLVAATCELALRALSGDLVEDVSSQYVESVTVGPISRTLSAPRFSGQKRFAAADNLLRDLVSGGEYNIPLVRA